MISTHFNFSKTKKLSDKSKLLIAFQKIGESRHSRKFQDLSKTNQIENLNVFSINNDYFKSSPIIPRWLMALNILLTM